MHVMYAIQCNVCSVCNVCDVCDVCNVCDVCEHTTFLCHIFIKHLPKIGYEFSIYVQILFQLWVIIIQNPNKNVSCRHLGRVLEPSGGCLRHIFGLRSIFLLILGGLCDQVGSILVPKTLLCDKFGPILAPKTNPKARISDFPYKNVFFIVCGFHFGGVGTSKVNVLLRTSLKNQ